MTSGTIPGLERGGMVLPKKLDWLVQDLGLKVERIAPLKTRWAEYEPWPFIQDGIEYNARITLGEDLKGRALYLIILHELAHYKADKQYGWGIRPHGKEWQAIYKQLVQNHLDLFSPDQDKVLELFNRYTAAKENNLIELLTPAA